MQFLFDGIYYKAARITGPKHNLLGLCLGTSEPVIISKLPIPNESKELVDEAEVLLQVEAGLAEINHELKTNYAVEKIQFLPTDTPCKTTYKNLTKAIITHLHKEQKFINTPQN